MKALTGDSELLAYGRKNNAAYDDNFCGSDRVGRRHYPKTARKVYVEHFKHRSHRRKAGSNSHCSRSVDAE